MKKENCSVYEINNDNDFIKCQKLYFAKGYNWLYPIIEPFSYSGYFNSGKILFLNIEHDKKCITMSHTTDEKNILNINDEIRKEKFKKINS